jgi:uncharacterized protein (TIGR03435 family)
MERLLFECAVRSTLIAAATAAVLSGMRIKNVVARHYAWTGVVLFMLGLPLFINFGYRIPLEVLPAIRQNAELVATPSAGQVPPTVPQIYQALPESLPAGSRQTHVTWLRAIEGIYIVGVAVLLLRLTAGIFGAYCIKRTAREVDGHLTSTSCSSPITVGCLRSVTILPEGWQDWAPAKLDAVLIHENEHVRRHDPFVQWLAVINRAIFWFHPLAWWLERRLASLSEEACDIAVLERGHDAADYSGYLLDLARSVMNSRRRIRVLGVAMPGRYLPQRIQKIVKGRQAPKLSALRLVCTCVVCVLLSVSFSTGTLVHAHVIVIAQGTSLEVLAPRPAAIPVEPVPVAVAEIPPKAATEMPKQVRPAPVQAETAPVSAAVPKFEVASVRPCALGDGAGGGVRGQRGGAGGGGSLNTFPGGRLVVNCMTLNQMINVYLISYDAERLINDPSRLPNDFSDGRRRVRGGPTWVYSDLYTINAETSDRAAGGPTGGPTPNALLQGPMLRLLLEDRFQLKTHRDTEEVDMYSLTVAKGGLKIQPMEEGGCTLFDPVKNRPFDTPPGQKPWCLQSMGFPQSDWTIKGAGQPMSNLVEMLTTVTGRKVLDKTGVSGLFNYNLRFAHDDTTPG